LTLKVRQEQRPDPESQFPQVALFQTPVDIEIGTASSTRIERVRIEAKEEQTFKFTVDAEPLLVNFDYNNTLIKELQFSKTDGQLMYQLAHDQDVLGRIWALQQLSTRMKDEKTTSADRQSIVKAISNAATKDQFWGARLDATTALNGSKDAKDALLTATKDANARVRAQAVKSLATTKDASLGDSYQQLLNDQSYAVIRAAAPALGQTKSPTAYDALMKIVDAPSWRDTIRASALSGLAALGDKRALDLGFKYFASENPTGVRAAAVSLLGTTGKDDPRTFPLISGALAESVERRSFNLFGSEAEALVALGDERGLAFFQGLSKAPGTSPQFAATLSGFEARLRAKLVPNQPKP
jgi:aminopeptidase N